MIDENFIRLFSPFQVFFLKLTIGISAVMALSLVTADTEFLEQDWSCEESELSGSSLVHDGSVEVIFNKSPISQGISTLFLQIEPAQIQEREFATHSPDRIQIFDTEATFHKLVLNPAVKIPIESRLSLVYLTPDGECRVPVFKNLKFGHFVDPSAPIESIGDATYDIDEFYLGDPENIDVDHGGGVNNYDSYSLGNEKIAREISGETISLLSNTSEEQDIDERTGIISSKTYSGALSSGNELDCETCSQPIGGRIYHWKNHALLSSVQLNLSKSDNGTETESDQVISDELGTYRFTKQFTGTNYVEAEFFLPEGEAENVVTSADALAALKIAVGTNPNIDPDGDGPMNKLPVSPYQYIAADVNGDNRVTSSDALAILKMAVNLDDASQRRWVFVPEQIKFWESVDETGLGKFSSSPSDVGWISQPSAVTYPVSEVQNLVGVMVGDVNGSWDAPQNAASVSQSYLASVQQSLSTPISQWAINTVEPIMLDFEFLTANNPGLEKDIIMSVDGDRISGRSETNVSVGNLIASFTSTGHSVFVSEVPQQSSISANDHRKILKYTVAGFDNQEISYDVDITQFTGLPIVYVTTEGLAPIQSKEDYVNGVVTIDGGRDYQSLFNLEMKIRGRGNSTWFIHPKKPYQMKLSDKSEFLGMPLDKKWLFLAEYSDKTMLRNTIAFEMGKLSTLDYTPQGRFAEVFLNNEYTGTYNITQKVEEGDNRVVLGDNGYLLEIDQLDRLDPDDVYFETDEFLINIKEPSIDADSDEHLYIRSHIIEFEEVLFSPNFADASLGYQKYIDVPSFIDWFLISEITKNVDSKDFSSIFLNHTPGGKIKMGPLWDFDLSFGNVDYSDSRYYQGFWVKEHAWYERLFEDSFFVKKVKERFEYYINNKNHIISLIDQRADRLRLAQEMNNNKWETIGTYVWPNPVVFDTYQAEVDHLKSWYLNRMDWLQTAFNDLSLVEIIIEDGQSIAVTSVPGILQAEAYTDMFGVETESTGDINGGQNIGYISEGDWFEYEIDVTEAGEYLVEYRIAGEREGGSFEVRIDGESVDQQSVPLTGGWQIWTTISHSFNLTAGRHRVRVIALSEGWNLNWIRFSRI